MVRRLISATLAAALILLSPGLDAGRALAAITVVRAPVQGISAGANASVSATLRVSARGGVFLAPAPHAPISPALSAPSSVLPSDAAKPEATVPQLAEQLAPALEAAAEGRSGAGADRANAQTIADVITGQRSIAGAGSFLGAAGRYARLPPLLSAPDESGAAAKAPAPAAPQPAPQGKVVSSSFSYGLNRLLQKVVTAWGGGVHSLPVAGPVLERGLLAQASDKRVVLADYDDTLAGYNQVLGAEVVAAIREVRAAGKEFAIISDRPTVFESLASLPADVSEGMYVAANNGGRIFRFENGKPVLLHEVPAMGAAMTGKIREASAAALARMLARYGAEMHVPGEKSQIPSEAWNPYNYALMLKIGSSEKQVRGAAAILEEECVKRGIRAEVSARFAKDAANPPYLNLKILTKEVAAGYIARALKAQPEETLILGDYMYAPKEGAGPRWVSNWGERLSGRALPKTGHGTDRDMERALPGALTLSVGGSADPRMSNAFVMPGQGAAASLGILRAVASKKAGAPKTGRKTEALMSALGLLALLAASGTALYFLVSTAAEMIILGEQLLRSYTLDPFDAGLMMLGGAALGTIKPQDSKEPNAPRSRAGKVLGGLLLAAAVAGSLYLWYTLYAGIGSLQPAPIEVPPGWEGPLPDIRGIEDLFGAAGVGIVGVMGSVRTQAGRALRAAVPFLTWLGLAALTVALYGGLYWAFTSAPAAVPDIPIAPFGWEGLFGAAGVGLGVGALSQPRVSDEEIRAAAASVIFYKGRPWSETEFNMTYLPTRDRLKASGATKKQLALFEKLIADAPLKGGSFNPWSGD